MNDVTELVGPEELRQTVQRRALRVYLFPLGAGRDQFAVDPGGLVFVSRGGQGLGEFQHVASYL